MTTKAEKRYLDRVAQLECVVCGAQGVHIHHAREGQGMGLWPQKLPYTDVVDAIIKEIRA